MPTSWGSPSSRSTSCATSARTCWSAGSTCRPRISTGSASPFGWSRARPARRLPDGALSDLIQAAATRARAWYDDGLRAAAAARPAKCRVLHRDVRHLPAAAGSDLRRPDARLRSATVPDRSEQGGSSGPRLGGQAGMSERVGVVGGGLAGITAALRCADAGKDVVLFEARSALGGLTTSFRRGPLVVDNGQHVFLRCCTAYRALLDRLGVADQVTLQDRLDIEVREPGRARSARLRRNGLPAPLHLAGSLLRYAPLSPADRIRLDARRAGAAPGRPGGPRRRQPGLRRLAGCPWPELPVRGRPLGPVRGRHAQCAVRGGVAGPRGDGVHHRSSHRCRRR